MTEVDDALVAFVSAALSHVEASIDSAGIPLSIRDPIEFTKDKGWSRRFELRPDWGTIEAHLREDLLALPEAGRAIEVMWRNKVPPLPKMIEGDLGVPEPSFEQARWFYSGELLLLLREYVEARNPITFRVAAEGRFDLDAQTLRTVILRHLDSWSASTFPHVVSVPLLNFTADKAETTFPDDLRIRLIDLAEKAHFYDPMNTTRAALSIGHLIAVDFVAEGFYETEVPTTFYSAPVGPLTRLLTALRLHQAGDVGALAYTDRIAPQFVSTSWSGGDLHDYWVPTDVPVAIYHLRERDVNDVARIASQLSKIGGRVRQSSLVTALRRFNQSYSRDWYEDRIIDLTIVLESMLLFGDSNELSYKLALRGAALLREQVDPERVFSTLRDLYKARSQIVHTGATAGELDKKVFVRYGGTSVFLPTVTEYVRRILGLYVSRVAGGEAVQHITESLDIDVVAHLGGSTQAT